MRSILLLVVTALILTVLNFGIYCKEQLRKHGETVLLELAPADPRSLMQGDYMRLRYAIERTVPKASREGEGKYLVISITADGVGQFVRFYGGGSLAGNEKLLRYHRRNGRIRISPDSFLFQEGHARYYREAKYGVFKFAAHGDSLLIGLAGSDHQMIKP